MEGKRSYLVPSVTTEAALDICLRERVGLFAVEGPLFLFPEIDRILSLAGYEVSEYPAGDFYICKCVRDEDRFDMEQYDIVYYHVDRNGMNK